MDQPTQSILILDGPAHLEHLLRFQLSLGLLPAEVLSDDVGEAVGGLVKLLVDDLHVQAGGLQGRQNPDRGLAGAHQAEGHRGHPLVQHPLTVRPGTSR